MCFYRSCGKFEIAFSPFLFSQFGSRICSLSANCFFIFALVALALLWKLNKFVLWRQEISLSYLVTFATLTSRLSLENFLRKSAQKLLCFFPVCKSFLFSGAKWKENLRLSETFLSSFTSLASNRIKPRCWYLTKWLFNRLCELTDLREFFRWDSHRETRASEYFFQGFQLIWREISLLRRLQAINGLGRLGGALAPNLFANPIVSSANALFMNYLLNHLANFLGTKDVLVPYQSTSKNKVKWIFSVALYIASKKKICCCVFLKRRGHKARKKPQMRNFWSIWKSHHVPQRESFVVMWGWWLGFHENRFASIWLRWLSGKCLQI